MVGIDPSVALRLFIGAPEGQAKAAQKLLDGLLVSGQRAAVPDLVVSEAYFALQFQYQVPNSKALALLRAMFESGEMVALGHAASVLETSGLASAKPGIVDRLIHAEYEANVDGMATFEKKAGRLVSTRILKG